MQKKLEKIFFDFAIIAFELVALDLAFTERECLSLGVNLLTKNLKISDTTKTEFLQLIFFSELSNSMRTILLCRVKHYFGPFKMLTVHKCSGHGAFWAFK